MVGWSSIPGIGNNDDETQRTDPSPGEGFESDRRVREDIDAVPFDAGTAEDDLAESSLEKIKAQPGMYALYAALAVPVVVAFLMFVVPFFPSITDPLSFVPLSLMALISFCILYGMKYERERLNNYGLYVSYSELLFGEFDRQKNVFYPIRGWSYRGIRANYLEVRDIAPEIANRYNKSVTPGDRAGIRLTDELVNTLRAPIFGAVAVAKSPELVVDEFGGDTALRPGYPTKADQQTLDNLTKAMRNLRIDAAEISKDRQTLLQQNADLRAQLRERDKDVKGQFITDVSDLHENISLAAGGGQQMPPGMYGGFGQRRGGEDDE